jgi:hypothetical protein
MAAFCSHRDRLHELAGVGRSAIASWLRQINRLRAQWRRAINLTMAAFGSRDDWSLEPAAHGIRGPDSDTAKFPQRPLILGDKWDF